jgi:methyl-accepting chemotaxis protein
MKFFRRLSLKIKILVAPLFISLFVLSYLAYSYSVGMRNANDIRELKENRFIVVDLAATNVGLLDKITDMLNSGTSAGEVEMIHATDALASEIRDNLKVIQTRSPKDEPILRELLETFDDYFNVAEHISLAMVSGDADFSQLQNDISHMTGSLEKTKQGFAAYKQSSKEDFVSDMEATSSTANQAIKLGIISGFVAIVLAIALSHFVASSIKNSMDEVVNSLREIAEGGGDLRGRIPQKTEDEIGTLVKWFNTFVGKLQSIITKLVDDVARLETMAKEMAQVEEKTENLLVDERQRILDVTEHVRIIAEQAGQVADNASSAANSSQEVRTLANQGKESVGTTIQHIESLARQIDSAVEATHQIEQDGNNINSVVQAIKDIADQTNLLALNAAIEAARAGEQGRGFAVVADEVRGLAEKTKNATIEVYQTMETLMGSTKTIVSVVSESQIKAETSVNRVQETGQMLEVMLSQFDVMSEMNGRIASHTDDQRKVADGVSNSSEELSHISGQVSGLSSQTGEIIRQVAELSLDIKHLSEQFQV